MGLGGPMTWWDSALCRLLAERGFYVIRYDNRDTGRSTKVPGRITQISKDVGDRSEAGEMLAQIEKTDYELARTQKQMAVQSALAKLGLTEMPGTKFDLNKVPTVERARLQSANAEAKFNRGKQLFEQKPPLISLRQRPEVTERLHQRECIAGRWRAPWRAGTRPGVIGSC